jgi:hypothetical protein
LRCSTLRSSWFGHQSWFVLGRGASGLGLGIAGFSLSLTLSVMSFLSFSLLDAMGENEGIDADWIEPGDEVATR